MFKKILISSISLVFVLSAIFFVQRDVFEESSNNGVAMKTNSELKGIKNAMERGKGNKNGIYKRFSDEVEDMPTDDFVNHKPVAVIDVKPGLEISTSDKVFFDHSKSYDQDGDVLANVEWIGIQDSYSISGSYEVYLRVQDEHGEWSDWSMVTLKVTE